MLAIDPVQEVPLVMKIHYFMIYSIFFFFLLYFLALNVALRHTHFLNAQRAVSVCPLSLSLPGAVKSHVALFVSSFLVPVTTGPSTLPSLSLSAAQCPVQFNLKSDFSFALAFSPPVASLVI